MLLQIHFLIQIQQQIKKILLKILLKSEALANYL